MKRSKRSVKTGLPPGSLIHVGIKSSDRIKITYIRYNNSLSETKSGYDLTDDMFTGEDAIHWINIDGLHDIELLRRVGKYLDLHDLTLEDILNTEQRTKLEEYEDYYYLVMRMLSYNSDKNNIAHEQVSLIIKDNIVITFQEKEGDVFTPVRERIQIPDSRIRRKGADYLLYALMDAIVDNYFLILEKIGDDTENIEENILTDPSSGIMQRLYLMKRNVILLRKTIWPLREVVGFLERTEKKTVKAGTKIFFRDLYDHTIQVIDNIESLRDLISGMVDIYLSIVSNRMNSVMKVLTIIATIFIPLTFIAGVYGMNFVFMPELEWKYGYPGVMLIMLLVVILMLIFFRKKNWL
jgi:magnesium transporter